MLLFYFSLSITKEGTAVYPLSEIYEKLENSAKHPEWLTQGRKNDTL